MEICVDCIESGKNAIEGGATRLELCLALSEGGLTPTPGLLKTMKTFSTISIYAMLRPRSGNFAFSEEEIECALHDLSILKDHGADGFVFGALTSDGDIDVDSCKKILAAARPLPVTFHRAFDEVNDPITSVETLIELGFERILTSGQRNTAEEGLELIKTLVEKAGNRIVIMPGSGITKDNIGRIKTATGAKEFHASAKKRIPLPDGSNRVLIGAMMSDFVTLTDRELVAEMVKIVNKRESN